MEASAGTPVQPLGLSFRIVTAGLPLLGHLHQKGIPLRTSHLGLVCATLLASGCTAVGWELQNYAFYGSTPTPDGRRLTPSNVVERVVRVAGSDSLLVSDGEFQIDTVREAGERVWVATRRATDSLKRPVIDSVWFDRYELHTLRAFHQAGDGRQYRQAFNRRVVKTELREPSGKVKRGQVMHEASPYSRIGIELVIGALRWQRNSKGALPVVSLDGREMRWLEFEVVGQTNEPRRTANGLVFQPVWVVLVKLDGQQSRWWIDDEDHTVTKRSSPQPDGSQLVVSLGRSVPKLAVFDVMPLPRETAPALGTARATAPASAEGRLLGGGRTLGGAVAESRGASPEQ